MHITWPSIQCILYPELRKGEVFEYEIFECNGHWGAVATRHLLLAVCFPQNVITQKCQTGQMVMVVWLEYISCIHVRLVTTYRPRVAYRVGTMTLAQATRAAQHSSIWLVRASRVSLVYFRIRRWTDFCT
jgi:hypothetical protein